MIGVKASTLSEWKKAYKQGGIGGLKAKKNGVKFEDKKLLTKEQEKTIQKMMVDKMPDQLKLLFALWTRKAVMEQIERELGIQLALTTMGDYLRSWGFLHLNNPRKKPTNKTISR